MADEALLHRRRCGHHQQCRTGLKEGSKIFDNPGLMGDLAGKKHVHFQGKDRVRERDRRRHQTNNGAMAPLLEPNALSSLLGIHRERSLSFASFILNPDLGIIIMLFPIASCSTLTEASIC